MLLHFMPYLQSRVNIFTCSYLDSIDVIDVVETIHVYQTWSQYQNLQGQGLFPQGQGKAKDLATKVKASAKVKDLACKDKAKDFISVHQSVV